MSLTRTLSSTGGKHRCYRFVAFGRFGWCLVDEVVEGTSEPCVGDFFFGVDVDGEEDGLVDPPAGFGSGCAVGGAFVGEHGEDVGEVGLDGCPLGVVVGDQAVGVGELAIDAGLFFAEEVDGYGSVEVGSQEPAAFGFEPIGSLALLGGFSFGAADQLAHRGAELSAQCVGFVGGQGDPAVEAGDLGLGACQVFCVRSSWLLVRSGR